MTLRALLCRFTAPLLGLCALAAFAPLAHAQATYDTPTIVNKRSGLYRIDFDVTAGTSGTPNGFVVQWMRRDDFLLYGWPADEYGPYSNSCDFTGTPWLTTEGTSPSYQLGAGQRIEIQMGDLYDESGVYGTYLDPIDPGYYVFRVWAEGDASKGASAPSQAVFANTSKPECTQGFWKNHPEVWPPSCLPMTLGTVSYTQAQLLAIFAEPVGGNGLIALAHQLIAAKLNACNGSFMGNIQTSINSADALIGGLVVPPVGGGSLSTGSTSSLTNSLDDFNNGIIVGVHACPGAVPARTSTWSRVKQLYR